MEFFFPADVFTAYPRQGPSTRAYPYGAGPATNIYSGCGFDSHNHRQPLFVDSLADAIQRERAAHARAQAQRSARAEAARQAKAAAAARRAAEERQAQAYLAHILEMQQREAQRRYQLEQLHRQRQEALRRQQYEEYQRRKAYAIEKERQRIASLKAAEDQSRQLFLALEDLLFGGLNGFCHAHPEDRDDEEEDDVELAHKNDTTQQNAEPVHPAIPQPQAIDLKGKGKAQDNDNQQPMDVDNNDQDAAAGVAPKTNDNDAEEVGPAPSSALPTEPSAAPASTSAPVVPAAKAEQLVFSHAFPADASFDKTSVRADQINVSVDETKRTVTVSGLWNNDPTTSAIVRSASPTPSDSSSRRGRSRSPKRARVSDVDENGEEIVAPDANDGDDDFVEINFTRAVDAPAQDKVEKTFDLPQGANIEDLRAELTDDGLKLYTTVTV